MESLPALCVKSAFSEQRSSTPSGQPEGVDSSLFEVNMKVMTEAQYQAVHPDYRGVWSTEKSELPKWEQERHLYMGKRTLLTSEGQGGTALHVEGISLEITP